METALKLLTLLLAFAAVRAQTTPANAIGSYSWKTALKHNVLFIDLDVSGKDDSTILAVTTYRYKAVVLSTTNADIKGFVLTHRNIGPENARGRMSYQVVPQGLNPGQVGGEMTVTLNQPLSRRLLLDQSPAGRYLAALPSSVDPARQSPSPHLVFSHRLLPGFSDSDTNAKKVQFPTSYMTADSQYLLNTLLVFHLFGIVYWFVALYLIFINPFFEYARKSVRIFWVGHYAMYFQFLSLAAYLSTHLYFEPDYVLYMLDCAQLRFFGFDYTAFSAYSDRKRRIGAYVGKFSNWYSKPLAASTIGIEATIEDPYVLCRQFPQFLIYLLAVILSAAMPARLKPMFVSMRLACTVCFGVQLVFRGTFSVYQFFAGVDAKFLDIANLIFGVIIALLPIVDVVLMKGQAGENKKEVANFWTVPKAKGALYFDIMGYSGHKKHRDYYPFPVGELDVALLAAILVCCFAFNTVVQNVLMLLMALLMVASVALQNQFSPMKFIKLAFNAIILIFYIFVFIIDFSPQVSVSTAKFLGTCIVVGIWLLLCLNLAILLYRLFDLMGDADSTYGEKAKQLPPIKIKPTGPAAKSKIESPSQLRCDEPEERSDPRQGRPAPDADRPVPAPGHESPAGEQRLLQQRPGEQLLLQ